jgi:hypothetical protein
LDTRVAGQKSLVLEDGPQIRLILRERLGKPVPHGAGLPGETAAGDADRHIILVDPFGDPERLLQDHPQDRTGEIGLEGPPVHNDLAGAGLDPDARDGVLALAGRIGAALFVELLHTDQRGRLRRRRGGLQILKG